MARGSAYKFARFGRGLNTTDGAHSLREGYDNDPQGRGSEARRLMNVVSKHRGNVRRRDGCSLSATLSKVPKDLSIIGQDSGSYAVYSSTDGALKAVSNAQPGVETALTTGLSNSAKWQFLRLPGSTYSATPLAYGMNGVDTPRRTDGTTVTNWVATSGAVPNGTIMCYHENTLFVAGVAANPYTLYWSAPGDPASWPVANVVDFAPSDGQPITGLASVGPYLLVFRERGVWQVYDSETGANRKVADVVGTLSSRSVVSTETGCYFLDPERGVMRTDGSSFKRVAEQLQQSFDSMTQASLAASTAAYWHGHYYLSINEGGTQVTYDYDSDQDSWWKHSTAPAAMGVWDRGSGTELIGAMSTSQMWTMFVSGVLTDNAAVFESYWSGPYHAFGRPDLRKRGRALHMEGRGTVDVYLATDFQYGSGSLESSPNFTSSEDTFGGGDTFGGAGTFGGTVEIGETTIFSLGVARVWSLTVYSATAQQWEMDSYTLRMDMRRD